MIEFLVGFFPSWFVTVNKNKKRSMKPNWKLIKRRRPIILPKTLEWNRASYIRPSARLPTTFFICIPPYSSLMLFIPRSSLHLRWLLVRQDWAILCVLGSTGRGHPLKNFHHHLSTQQHKKGSSWYSKRCCAKTNKPTRQFRRFDDCVTGSFRYALAPTRTTYAQCVRLRTHTTQLTISGWRNLARQN